MKHKGFLNNILWKVCLVLLVYLIAAGVGYWIIADDWSQTAVVTASVSKGYLVPADNGISQQLSVPMEVVEKITVTPHWNREEHPGKIVFSLTEEEKTLWSYEFDCATLVSDEAFTAEIVPYIDLTLGRELILHLSSSNEDTSFWAGDSVSTGKFEVQVATNGLTVNGTPMDGQLVMVATGHIKMQAVRFYWPVAMALLALILLLICLTYKQKRRGKRTLFTVAIDVYERYTYLLKQLVWRDFHVKYRSSMLGMLWSFLNPLLTMFVYYFVFSTLFKSDIAYFPVYLMSGIVLFNYFSESTGLGLTSIVGNSALITKVYMPKYIYPLSKVLSSAINLCISFIPLLLVMLLTGMQFHKSLLLLPWVVGCLIMFSLGISLILATMYVFFRDTQFLWGVLVTLWNFLTPIFYPESIIPAQFLTLYHLNPLYQIVYFMRSITINGVSPTPITYFYCLLSSGIPLVIGLFVFRKYQDKFVLHL